MTIIAADILPIIAEEGLELVPKSQSTWVSKYDKTGLEKHEEFPTLRHCVTHINACGCLILIAYFLAIYVCVILAIVNQQLDGSAGLQPNNYFVSVPIRNSKPLLLPYYTRATLQDNGTSPQSLALQWLSTHSRFSRSPTPLEELFALATICHSLDVNLDLDCVLNVCEKESIETVTIKWSEGHRITSLILKEAQLDAKSTGIPPEIELLTELKELIFDHSFTKQNLTTVLPPQMARLSKLETLEFKECGLSGTLPKVLGDLTTLTSLSFNKDHLTGTLPTELTQLSNLQVLDLSDNILSGTIPTEMGLLTSLTILYLEQNSWNETVTPPELCSLQTLQALGHVECDGIPCAKDCPGNGEWIG